MAKFIVLTDYEDNPICININKIEYIQRPLPDKETGGECYTEVVLNHKTAYVKQTYEEVIVEREHSDRQKYTYDNLPKKKWWQF